MNLRQFIAINKLIDLETVRIADLYNTKGEFKSKKGAIMYNSGRLNIISALFSFVNAMSSKTRDLIQTYFNSRFEGK